MLVSVSVCGKYTVLKAAGKLDASTAESVQIEAVREADKNSNLILDFSELEYISSSGLRTVLMLAKKSAAGNGDFAIAGAKGAVSDVFKMSGFDTLMKMTDTVEEAAL